MYWSGVVYVLDWSVVYTGLVCCMYWTDVLYVGVLYKLLYSLDGYVVCLPDCMWPKPL